MLKWLKRSALFLSFILVLTGCSTRAVVVHQQQAAPTPAAIAIPPLRKGPLLVIDPGHGGKDQGTHSEMPPRYEEKVLALETSYLVEYYLQRMGYRTLLLRGDDRFIALPTRASIANDLHAKLFVSIHFNSAESTAAQGIEVYYYNSDKSKERTKASKLLAKEVHDEILLETKAKTRGVKEGNFAVIRETKMPAILVEGGFLTHDKERQCILDSAYRHKLALGIAEGIDKYLKKNANGTRKL